MQAADFPVITITQGMSGYFAVMYRWNNEDGGFPEAYETGFGRYPITPKGEADAIEEASCWAQDEEIRLEDGLLDRRAALISTINNEELAS
jgi:hypothetical protein